MCRGRLEQTCKSWLSNFQESCESVDIMLIAWNWLWREYLHHRIGKGYKPGLSPPRTDCQTFTSGHWVYAPKFWVRWGMRAVSISLYINQNGLACPQFWVLSTLVEGRSWEALTVLHAQWAADLFSILGFDWPNHQRLTLALKWKKGGQSKHSLWKTSAVHKGASCWL